MDNLSSYFKGYNFMTQDIIKHGEIGDRFVYELSTGRGLDQQAIFRLTLFDRKAYKIDHHLSRMFNSKEEVYSFINNLGETI